MSAGSKNLTANQRQLDMDGCEVGVSRQAVEETLTEYADMVTALQDIASGNIRVTDAMLASDAAKRWLRRRFRTVARCLR